MSDKFNFIPLKIMWFLAFLRCGPNLGFMFKIIWLSKQANVSYSNSALPWSMSCDVLTQCCWTWERLMALFLSVSFVFLFAFLLPGSYVWHQSRWCGWSRMAWAWGE
jgi:hypothetical protein